MRFSIIDSPTDDLDAFEAKAFVFDGPEDYHKRIDGVKFIDVRAIDTVCDEFFPRVDNRYEITFCTSERFVQSKDPRASMSTRRTALAPASQLETDRFG